MLECAKIDKIANKKECNDVCKGMFSARKGIELRIPTCLKYLYPVS